MTRQELRKMRTELLSDARLIVQHNRVEARQLVRAAVAINKELYRRSEIDRLGYWRFN